MVCLVDREGLLFCAEGSILRLVCFLVFVQLKYLGGTFLVLVDGGSVYLRISSYTI